MATLEGFQLSHIVEDHIRLSNVKREQDAQHALHLGKHVPTTTEEEHDHPYLPTIIDKQAPQLPSASASAAEQAASQRSQQHQPAQKKRPTDLLRADSTDSRFALRPHSPQYDMLHMHMVSPSLSRTHSTQNSIPGTPRHEHDDAGDRSSFVTALSEYRTHKMRSHDPESLDRLRKKIIDMMENPDSRHVGSFQPLVQDYERHAKEDERRRVEEKGGSA